MVYSLLKKVDFIKFSVLFVFAVLFGSSVFAQSDSTLKIIFKIEDENFVPIPYVEILLKTDKSSKLLLADKSGLSETRLNPESKYFISIEHPGYKKFTSYLYTGNNEFGLKLILLTKKTAASMAEANADKKNPANEIIKTAIRSKNSNIHRVESYSAHYQMKSKSTVTAVKGWMPSFWEFSYLPQESDLGIRSLTETYSVLYYRHFPRLMTEVVTDIKTAVNKGKFDIPSRTVVQTSFYDALIDLWGFDDRTYVSPLAYSAFLHYKYQIIETYYKSEQEIYRISVTPKNQYGKFFRGEISIAKKSSALCGVNLIVDDKTTLFRVDSVRFIQDFTHLKNDVWIPSKLELSAHKKMYGRSIEYSCKGVLTKILINDTIPQFANSTTYFIVPDTVFHLNENQKANKSKLKTDAEETAKYKEYSDIVRLQNAPKSYRDSVSKANRAKPVWYHPFVGGSRISVANRKYFSFDGLINDKLEYNTIEGFCYKYGVLFRKTFSKNKTLEISPLIRFGSADKRFKSKIAFTYQDPKFNQISKIEGGSNYVQINQTDPINALVNTAYTLFLRTNYMKLYRKDYVKLSHSREIINGFYFNSSLEYANRNTLEDKTDFYLMAPLGGFFTPNNPNAIFDPNYFKTNNKLFKFQIGITFRPRQRYAQFFERKIVMPSIFPEFSINYTKGLPGVLGSTVNYDLIEFRIQNEFKFTSAGKSSLVFKTGFYPNRNNMTYYDYTHFMGERTYFLGTSLNVSALDQFRTLDYYRYSTNNTYLEFHFQHDFQGSFLNKVPLLNRLKWNFLTGLNYVQIFDSKNNYFAEAFFGINNVLGAWKLAEMFNIRVDMAGRFGQNLVFKPTFLLGLNVRLNEIP